MTKKPEGCEKFEEVINKIINKGNVPPEELNVLLDNPLAFADFMSKYYNDCLKKSSNTKKLFSMTTLNNDNIKILMSMDEGFDYIDKLSEEFKKLLNEVTNIQDIIQKKFNIGENQVIIIIKGLKKMFKIDSTSPIDMDRKKHIDILLQTFMKRDYYNKVVKNPNYRAVSTPFWNSLKKVGNEDTFGVYGTPYCGKGEPNQCVRVGHAAPICVFDNIDIFGGS